MPNVPAALEHADFRIFWGGATLSAFGSQFATVATAWQIYELTNSPTQIGLLGLARVIPQMILSLYGGLLADAIDRQRLLIVTQGVQLIGAAGLALLTALNLMTPAFLYASAVIFAICSALGQPSRQAIVPNLVPREDVGSAVALNNTSNQLSQIAGPTIAGIVLAAAGTAWCYAINAVSWLAIMLALAVIRADHDRGAPRSRMTVSAMMEGFTFLRGQPLLLAMLALDCAAMLFGEPRALMPIYPRDLYHVGPQGLGLLYGATSIGSFAAAGALAVWGQPRNTGFWVIIGLGIFGLCAMAFAYTPEIPGGFWLGLLFLAIMGFGDSMNAVLRITMNQLLTPDELRGRVSAVSGLLTGGGSQLGQVESGVTAGWWGAEGAALFGGAATLAFVIGVTKVPGLWSYKLPRSEMEPVAAVAKSPS